MNQDKIGNFIKKCRTEKKMTQADLAEKLGVSSKAISKWECGKGLPDVSLFESICEELDISLNELFAGEKIADKDIASKSEKTILKLAQENQNQKFSIKRVFKVTVIIIILFCYIFCKTLAYMSYVTIKKDLNEQYHVAKLAKIFNERESFIIHAKDNDEDAITFNGLSIRDDYQDYEIISNSNNYLTYAILSIESNRIIKEFSIFYNADNGNSYKYWNNVFENEKKKNILERLFDSGVDLSKDFKKFEVNNDIGLYNYFFEKYNNDSNNIMSPIFNIKKQGTIYDMGYFILNDYSRFIELKGDFDGYILYYKDNNYREQMYEIHLNKGNDSYLIYLSGDNYDDVMIQDVISTIKFV